MFNVLAVGVPVASKAQRGLYGVVEAWDGEVYAVKWQMQGYDAVTFDNARADLIELEWVKDSES